MLLIPGAGWTHSCEREVVVVDADCHIVPLVRPVRVLVLILVMIALELYVHLRPGKKVKIKNLINLRNLKKLEQ